MGSMLVGVAREEGLSVKLTLSVGIVTIALVESPVAVIPTVVARSLAVPHPYWEKPPANTFL